MKQRLENFLGKNVKDIKEIRLLTKINHGNMNYITKNQNRRTIYASRNGI